MTTTATAAIVGTWTATSEINGESNPYKTTFVFHPNHVVEAFGPEGPDGKPFFSGRGHWISRQDGTFIYHLSHPLPDHTGGPDIGVIYSIQQVSVSGSAQTSTGSAILERADGTIDKPVSVTLSGKRS